VILCKSRRKWFLFLYGCPLLCTQDKLCNSKPFNFVHSVEIGRLAPIPPFLFHLKSPKNAWWKLATFLDIKGNKIFHNIKSHWISIIFMQAHCGWIQNINCKDVKRSSQEWSYMIQHVKVVECGAYIWPLLHLETP
jgi:hypothetical protein